MLKTTVAVFPSGLLNFGVDSSMMADGPRPPLKRTNSLPGLDRRSAPENLARHPNKIPNRQCTNHHALAVPEEVDLVPLSPMSSRTMTVDSVLRMSAAENVSLVHDSENSAWSSFAPSEAESPCTSAAASAADYDATMTPAYVNDLKAISAAKQLLTRCIIRDGEINRYTVTDLLGFGTFGIVVRASDNLSGRIVAIKIMDKSKIHASRVCYDPRTAMPTLLEIALLKYVPSHPNIIGYVGSWQDEECWYLVTEYGGHSWKATVSPTSLFKPQPQQSSFQRLSITVPSTGFTQNINLSRDANNHSLAGLVRACGGYSKTANDIVRTGRPVTTHSAQRTIFKQLAEAVREMHHAGMVHRDLKAENVLVDADYRIQLIDFGHAAFYQTASNPNIRPFKAYGTPLFAPPEVRSGLTYVGPEADVYALGLILYEMNSGDMPTNLEDAAYCPNGETCFDVSFGSGFFTEEIRDLCKWMLCPDPVHRPSIDQVLAHGWFV